MSNKFRNYFLISALMLILQMFCPDLIAFEPNESTFETRYQFELYQSWLQKGKFKTQFPAAISKDKIIKTFIDAEKHSVMVEYDWVNHRITGQREVASYLFARGDAVKIWSIIKYIEGFIYRLNTRNLQFLSDYMSSAEVEIHYGEMTGEAALNQLWSDFEQKRARFHPIEIEWTDNRLIFALNPVSGNLIKLAFPLDFDLQEEKKKLIMFEKKVSAATDLSQYLPQKILSEQELISLPEDSARPESDEFLSSFIPPEKTISPEPAEISKPGAPDYADLTKIDESDLAAYIQLNFRKKQTRELLNNKINDPLTFLRKEFPDWELNRKNNIYHLSHPPIRQDFHCDIKVRVEIQHDGLDILPAEDYYFLGKYMIFSGDEKIDLRDLNDSEIEQIAPYIPQLVYGHRSLGTRLLNFLLIHDNVPTTLIVQNEERRLYEMDSYANLLLLLNKFWQKRTVYFSILNVKKVSGLIEFQSYLIAHDAERRISDIADIKFQLDKDYRITLIMMVLHPRAEF